ncbi:TIGR04282 family arsenosugar biosynthesis glycosyltransferase [Salinimicrobium sp. MT39]|uniref:TIGR04282 family arsenosugar biosynthesis glycosyltransferase n=1 Tax=Salinimicrobium profundisediminis TaxID=2994553 RepID=A0A9X3CWT8_9FLAO|nr:TIGR04282 family arsenosugar biosynthesis glycosyltransferase [Salinimicrobium profundisediminis]MCX2838135.1 TIGR04282 family arsenosugar biosynthesis glycosyltransferase [Salinimicrobium profundisediminis]
MKEKTDELLLIFTRNPEKGKVKKRLAQSIGDDAALKVYNYLLQHTVTITQPLPVEKWVYYSEALPENDIWNKEFFRKKLQQGQDLGQRMEQAFSEAFKAGFKKVVIIGSDLFDIEKEDLKMAFLTLKDHEYVVGPAQDGGYFLLGMKKPTPQLFRNKDWSTSRVLDQTLSELEQEKLKLLPVRNDIDTFEDMRSHPELVKLID